jgi:NAD-dependent dihydropyrimidine dehydrogenase PreA subunit
MAIKVIEENCTACGECVLACPCDVLRIDDETGKCSVKYPYDCQLCNLCVYYCQFDALELSSDKDGKLVLSWS